MKLTKQTKMLLGVGVLGVAAYFIWKQNQKKQNFISRSRRRIFSKPSGMVSTFGDEFGGRPTLTLGVPTSQESWIEGGCKVAIGCTKMPDGSKLYTCAGIDPVTNVRNMSNKIAIAGEDKTGGVCN